MIIIHTRKWKQVTEQEMMQKILASAKSSVPVWAKAAICLLLCALLTAAAIAGYNYLQKEHAVLLTQQQLADKVELAKALDVSQGTAKKLAAEIVAVKEKEPEIRYIETAPNIDQAAVKVQKDIDAGKSPACAIPADKTIVATNPGKQTVEVFRITLDKAKWGVNGLVLAGGSDPAEVGAGPSYYNKGYSINAGATSRGRGYVMVVKLF